MGSDKKVGLFRKDVPSLPFSRHGPKHTAFDRGIYSFEGIKEAEINLVEKRVMSPIDNYAAKVIDRLLKFGPSGLSKNDLDWLFVFKASLEMRNPTRLKSMQDMAYSLITEDLTDRSEVEREVLEFIEDHPELHRNIPLQGLGPIICNTARRFRSYLKHWGVVEFTGRRKNLLLSDFPCIRTTGVGRPNAVFALPLSPRKAVLGFKTLETQQIYLGGMSRGELLSRINESSFAQTTRCIYALDETPRLFLERRLRSEVRS